MSSNTLSLVPIFSPTQISGCKLWIDAADSSTVTLSSGTVANVRDKSGSGFNLSNGAGFSYPNNTFNGTYPSFYNLAATSGYRIGVNASISVSQPFTVFMVAERITGSTSVPFWFDGQSSRVGAFFQTSTQLGFIAGSFFTYDVTLTKFIACFIPNSSASDLFLNGSYATTGNPGANALGGIVLGNNEASSVYPFNGHMCEFLIYNTAVSTSQRQQVEGYLAWKWGLQDSLPASHPYKNSPISPINSLPPSIPSVPVTPLALSTSPFSFFNPNSLSSCSLWIDAFDASKVSQSGGAVTGVIDKSSNAYTFSNGTNFTYNQTKFNGIYPSFYTTGAFSSGNIGSNSSIAFSQPMTIFTVVQPTATAGSFPFVMDSRVSSPRVALYYWNNAGYRIRLFAGAEIEYQSGTSQNPAINSYYLNTTTSQIFLNATSVVTGDIGGGSFSGMVLGNAYTNDAAIWGGHICEILIYRAVLSAAQRQTVEGYLAWKWGLPGNLPSNHPYKNAPPGLPVPSVPTRLTMSFKGFSPLNISGIQMWLDATDINGNGTSVANGASVTTWTDKSGAGNSGTGGTSVTVNSTGINNLPVLSFSAAPSYFNSVDLYSNRSFSVFLIAKRQAANNTGQGFIGGTTTATNQNMILLYGSATIVRFAFFGNDLDATIPAYTGNTATEPAMMFSFTYTPGSRNIFINGAFGNSDTNATNLTASLGERIGYWGNNSSFAFNGFLGEIVVLNGVPTTQNRQSMEGYLAWKWGLVGSLPSNHPYKKWPPPS